MKLGITLDELNAEVMRRATVKEDFLAKAKNITMEHDDYGLVMRLLGDSFNDVVEPLDVNATAHRQIGAYTGIPSAYYERMLADDPELLTRNVNSWLGRDDSPRMVRTLGGTARAFLSGTYRRIDHPEIMRVALPELERIPGVRIESCEITDDRMYIKAVNPKLTADVAPGDTVQAGVAISNSETGQGSVWILPLIYRLICTNGMTVNAAATRNRKIHRGSAQSADENYHLYSDETKAAIDAVYVKQIRDLVRTAVDEAMFGKVVGQMREAKDAKMDTANIPAVVKLASVDFKLTESEGEGVLKHFINDKDYTLYGLANAVTRLSQDLQSYERASELEGIGYKILSMDARNWRRINNAVHDLAA